MRQIGRNRRAYSKHKKDYCENIDGRFGFVCESKIRVKADLHGDHIDGNIFNNNKENIQTLCPLCHNWKTNHNKDFLNKHPTETKPKANVMKTTNESIKIALRMMDYGISSEVINQLFSDRIHSTTKTKQSVTKPNKRSGNNRLLEFKDELMKHTTKHGFPSNEEIKKICGVSGGFTDTEHSSIRYWRKKW